MSRSESSRTFTLAEGLGGGAPTATCGATSNGDPTNRTVFSSAQRDAFSGMAVAIVRALPGQAGEIVVTATSGGLEQGQASIASR